MDVSTTWDVFVETTDVSTLTPTIMNTNDSTDAGLTETTVDIGDKTIYIGLFFKYFL